MCKNVPKSLALLGTETVQLASLPLSLHSPGSKYNRTSRSNFSIGETRGKVCCSEAKLETTINTSSSVKIVPSLPEAGIPDL